MFIYSTEKNLWIEVNLHLDTPRWNHMSVLVQALPRWKLFIFGGSVGYFEEGCIRNFGQLSNDILCITLEENLDNSTI